jgi:ferric-dicitrate binding protein FerR (iron transport regulator)
MENIFDIVTKHISGEKLTGNEELQLQQWLSVPENKAVYTELQKVWKLSNQFHYNLNIDVDAEWEHFKHLRDSNKVRYLNKPRRLQLIAVAASIIVLLGIFGILSTKNNQQYLYQTAQNTEQIQLPDNTRVWLNAESSLLLDKAYNKKNRNVKLKGEAYFEVEKNAELPFVIESGKGLRAKVLGTSFNLQVKEQSKTWALNVFSGKVWFGNSNKNALVVEKEQQVYFDTHSGTISKQEVFNRNAISWKNNQLIFNNTPLESVASQLSEYFGKQVILPDNVQELRYSGTFDNPSEKNIAQVIALAMGWEYKITNKAIVFTPKTKSAGIQPLS